MQPNNLGAHRPNCFCWKCTGRKRTQEDRNAEILRELRSREPEPGEHYATVFTFRSQQATNDR